MAALWKGADTVPLLPRKERAKVLPTPEEQLVNRLDDDINSNSANLTEHKRFAEGRKLPFFRRLSTVGRHHRTKSLRSSPLREARGR